MSPEQRKQISETLKRKGIKPPSRKGVKLSEELKQRLSQIHKGKSNLGKFKKGLIHSEEWRKLMSEKMKGVNCYFWKGGITEISQKIRTSLEYKLWRESVFKRDNYTCIWCGDNQGGNLEADHIKPFALYPELRFAIDNGRTLCKSCHKTTDTYGRKLKSYQ